MPKQTLIDKAIANLEAERAVLDSAIAKLRQQQQAKPARKPKAYAPRPVEDRSA